MSNLNFEPVQKPNQKKSKKQNKNPNTKNLVVIGLALLVVVGFLGVIISSKQFGNQESGPPKPDRYTREKILKASRVMNVEPKKIWEFYCNHDPDGYLHYLDDQYGERGLAGKLTDLKWEGIELEEITAMAIVEVYRQHDFEDKYWNSFINENPPEKPNNSKESIYIGDWLKNPPKPTVQSHAVQIYNEWKNRDSDFVWQKVEDF